MSRKKELLDHYADYHYRYIKYFFPMLMEEIDIKKIKENINEEEKISKSKEKIDSVFKDKICEYLNTKLDIAKMNIQFLDNDYNCFEFDYELSDKILWFLNYKWVKAKKDFPELVDDFTIEDSKNLLKDFYKELLHDNPNDYNYIEYIIDNKINVIYEDDRAVTNVSSKEINISYSSDLLFLIILAHETAHSYAYLKKDDLMGEVDLRIIELESSFMENLFIKYLKDKKIPIIREDDKVRPVNEDDYDTYFLSIVSSIFDYAYRIIDEKDFVDNLNKNFEFDREAFDDYLSYSPYNHNYIMQATFINDILNDYIYDEFKKSNINDLKDVYSEIGLYNHNEFGSFKFSVRYIYSYLMSLFFKDICDDKKNIKYFLEILNNKNDYSAKDVCDMFGVEIDDLITLPSKLVFTYADILKKNDKNIKFNPYISKDYIEREKKNYVKMIENNKNNDGSNQESMILIRELFHLYNKTNIVKNMYSFDIDSQLEDPDVERIDEVKKKLRMLL